MKTNRWVSKAAGVGALTLILAMPAVAQTRGNLQRDNGSNRTSQVRADARNNRGGNRTNSGYNNNDRQAAASSATRASERVSMQGRVSSMSHENGGYRVRLDRDSRSFWVPESYVRSRGRNFGIGVSISLGGVFRGGQIYVDAVNWPGDSSYGYSNGYVRGVVDRVDYRSGVLWLRDDASGRLIQADMRGANRYGRVDARDLRRGDYVELSGQWLRGNLFAVGQVASVRSGRY